MSPRQVVEADLTWLGGRFEPGVRVAIDAAGRIESASPGGPSPTRRLQGRALLPGFVNAHSHAFQRGLRGRAERYPERAGDFWSWRGEMYRLVESLDRERFFRLTRAAFAEMLDAGITAVGEFHYLHHSPDALDFAFDELVVEAAAEVGIRLVLIEAAYRTGGVDRPLEPAQRRFDTRSSERFERQLDALAGRLDPERQHLGVAAHSLRAVPPGEVAELARSARRRDLPFHLHLEEQRREIDEVLAATGRRPFELLAERLAAGGVTAVHCTHSRAADLHGFGADGGVVCLCPLTEASLADGVADLPAMDAAAATLALGTDSNARISMLEEMRWLEYAQRLARERRGVVRDAHGEVAPRLLAAATSGGAASLGLPAGDIAPGRWADFAVVDLGHASLAGIPPGELAAALVFGAGDGAVAAAAVGGRWRDAALAGTA